MEDNNKDINNWLAVTRSRNEKWWYSAFHNMIEMHEAESGKRFDRYHELGQYAFGEKLGLWIVVPQTLIVHVGTDIIYMITGGNSLKKAHQILCKNCKPIKTTYFIMIFASLQFFLSHLPSFNSIIGVSISAAVIYSTIVWTSSAHKGALPDVKYDGRSSTTIGNVFDFFTGLGTIAFGYAAHNVLLEIQATVPSTPEKPSKKAMWKGMIAAYIVVGLFYFPVAIFGYWAFGNSVTDNILMSLDKPHWLTAVANIFVVIHVTGSYQVFAVPVFDMMESLMVRRMNFKPTWYLRFISRNIYVALTMLVATIFPFFGGLLSFLGGLVFAPTTYFLPCIIWLVVYKPKRFSGSWCANWFCIVFGVLLMVLGSIGAMREIILQAKDYKFFS
ncbi:hypothetical protein Ahy_A01g002451 [Arachis hypogaea]|uniref:Amino acid transporter transmembrane domain-containing protein n=1 Tax=Arachis hypogaea TaxID=3818 RepID=A0A445EQQ6_ARAHY|nr:hypothetical protein Ahy_A01g002451 [Arachis hypogaea]